MSGATSPCPFCSAAIDPTVDRCPWCDNPLAGLLQPGTVVGDRFEVVSAHSAGPLGTSYRVRDHQQGTEAYLRRVADELLPGLEERGAFAHQVQTFVGRSIAGCAMPLASGADERFAWVVGPYAAGATVRAVIDASSAASRPISLEESLRVLCAVASAMAAMHAVTAHGALWPEHVVLTARGAVLTDGALASAIAPERWQPRLAGFRDVSRYVAPEVAGRKKVTATADLFAFGSIAAELLTGEPGLASVEASSELGPEVKAALRVLLDRDRGKRAGGASQLLDALSRACGFERRPADVPNPANASEFGAMPRIAVAPAPIAAVEPALAPRAANAPVAPPPVVKGAVLTQSSPSMQAVAPRTAPANTLPPVPPSRPASIPPPAPAAAHPSTPPAAPGPRGPDRIPRGGLPGQSRAEVPVHNAPASGAPMPLLPKMPPVQAPPPPRIPSLPSVPGLASSSAPRPKAAPAVPSVPSVQRAVPSPSTRDAKPASPSAGTSKGRGLDDIDPRLLRAARTLQAEREITGETIDDADLEEVE